MRVLYIAPRFHTNQAEIMKGWISTGDTLCFISQYTGRTEDYSSVCPVVLGYSPLYRLLHRLYVALHAKDPYADDRRFRYGVPPVFRLRQCIRGFQPDLVILREKSVYSMVSYAICRKLGAACILYTQSPLWQEPEEIHTDFLHRMAARLLPAVRMTPVLGRRTGSSVEDVSARYIPFVMGARRGIRRPDAAGEAREAAVRIFCVGKYERRKNLHMMLEVMERMEDEASSESMEAPVHLWIAGECSNSFHAEYKAELERYIREHGLTDKVKLLRDQTGEQMDALYRAADLFVLPSSREPASISQLEAMAYGLPVICSDTNGTACYVENGRNGYLFRDGDPDSLYRAVRQLAGSRRLRETMGAESLRLVKERHSFASYRRSVLELMEMAGNR